MIFRRLVNDWVRQTLQEKIQRSVTEVARDALEQPRPEGEPTANSREPEVPACGGAFVFATGPEAGGLVDRLRDRATSRIAGSVQHVGYLDDRPVRLIESGTGWQAAERATQELITLHPPSWVISAGFADALCKPLRRNCILMADEVANELGERLPIELKVARASLENWPALHIGRLLTINHSVGTAAEKHTLGQQHGALACDRETMAIAQACQGEKVPFLSVRIITTEVDDHLPREIEQLRQQPSLAAKLGAATGAILHRPSSAKDIWKLKEDALTASDRLARFLAGLADQLTGGTSHI